ncbi:MAG: RidA family protein [Candidatus Kapaibacteriota bacterium]|jgi:2-iminobutanoate/2-iminopropanoate deaminase
MKNFITFSLVLFMAVTTATAQEKPISKEKIHENKESEDKYGYTAAVKAGNTIYVSGVAARGPMNEAIPKVYNRIAKILEKYGATMQNVVKETVFTTQYDELLKYNDLRKEFYKGDFPSATWVQISRLFTAEVVLEVEVTAVLANK